jgi:hypothetical protein
MAIRSTLLTGIDQQIEKLKAGLADLASGDVRRQESVKGGAWRDCLSEQIHDLTNMIGTLEALAALLRDPPPGMF